MKRNELIEQLNTAKALSSTVDIDKVIELIKQIETPTTISAELGSEIVSRIERVLDNNSHDLVDLDSAEFELGYNNRIELSRVDVNIDEIMEHVNAVLEEFMVGEDEGPEFDSAGFSIADRFDDEKDEPTHHCDDLDCNCSI